MARFEGSITVNASAEKVFDYVADLTRHPEWSGRPLQVRKTSDGPVGIGSTFESTGKQFGTHTDTLRVLEYSPPSRIVFESSGDAGVVNHWYTVSEAGGTATLTKGLEFVKPALSTKIFMPVVKMVAPKDNQTNLARIKQRIEGTA